MGDKVVITPPTSSSVPSPQQEMASPEKDDSSGSGPGFSKYLEVAGESQSPKKIDSWADSTGKVNKPTAVDSTSNWRHAKPFAIKATLLASICSALLGYGGSGLEMLSQHADCIS